MADPDGYDIPDVPAGEEREDTTHTTNWFATDKYHNNLSPATGQGSGPSDMYPRRKCGIQRLFNIIMRTEQTAMPTYIKWWSTFNTFLAASRSFSRLL